MNEPSTRERDVNRLILVPALITLAVTAARLAGELLHGPRLFFNSEPGGPWAIVGIVWLAPIFGVYFALKLVASGHGPKSLRRAVGFASLGIAVVFACSLVGALLHLQVNFRARLLYLWIVLAVAALITRSSWPSLFRVLLAYGYAARVPVAIVMFFAFWRDWGTHYDAVPPDIPTNFGLLAKYAWLGLFPQLIFWVGVSVLTGMFCGSLAAALASIPRRKLPS